MPDHRNPDALETPPSPGDGASAEPPIDGGSRGGVSPASTLAGGIPMRVRRRRHRSRWARFKSWVRRHKALSALLALMLTLIIGLLIWLWWLLSQIDGVTRFDLDPDNRPDRVSGDQLNILVLGVDDLDYQRNVGPDIHKMLESGTWQRGAFRSDTMMLVHLEADRRSAQVVSIPRDSYVDIPGETRSKINAAFSWGGPDLAVETVEHNFGVYVDHVVVVNFAGFEDITDILNGVDIHFAEDTQADGRGRIWTAGLHRLGGADALYYVRQRYDLARGDFDRIHRQQNYLRSLMNRVLADDLLLSPVKTSRLVGELSDLLAVDSSLTNSKLRSLALSSRHLRSGNIRFVTVPNSGSATIDGASVVQLRLKLAREMFAALEDDNFESWYAQNEIDELPAFRQVG